MQTFEECVKSINEDKNAFSDYELLYFLLNVEEYPLNDENCIEKHFSFLSKIMPSIDIIDKNENKRSYFNWDLRKEFFSFLIRKINVHNIQPIKLQFDGTTDDLKNFTQSVLTVLEFNRTLENYIAEFLEEKLKDGRVYRVSRESVFIFASKFLHGCFPECFISFDIKLYGKSKRLFHDDECVVRDCVVSDEIKQTLYEENERVYDCFDENLRLAANHPEKERYLYFCAKVYALCRYLKEHITDIEYNPITLALAIFESVVTTEWKSEKKNRIFAHIEDNVGKNKPSVVCAVSEDGEHIFKCEVEGNLYDYREIISNTEYDLYPTLDIPAAKVLAAFERFCKDECGFTTYEDIYGFTSHENEIVFAEYTLPTTNEEILGDFFHFFLDNREWVSTRFIENSYSHETAYLNTAMNYRQFKETCDTGLSEPYATKHLYDEYMRLVHKDKYEADELDQMEQNIKSHLNALYKDTPYYDGETIKAQISISLACQKICLCDFKRFTALMDYIVEDYKNRTEQMAEYELWNLLSTISDAVYCDCHAPFNIEETYFEEYDIYRCLSPENFRIVKEIVKKYEEINKHLCEEMKKK